MNRIAFLYLGSWSVLLASCATDGRVARKADVHTIPLNEVWAFEMPGTHDIRELEPDKFGERTRNLSSDQRFRLLDESKTFQIRAALKKAHPRSGNLAQPGFAVIGTGTEALDGAYDVLVNSEKPVESFPLDSNVTLVFCSHFCGRYVHLDSIDRERNTIRVKYRFVPHNTLEMTWHIALIPVGKLPVGKYRVEIIQLPGSKDKVGHFVPGLSEAEAAKHVCGPFSFSVVGRKE